VQLVELNIGMDDPSKNPEFLDQYLADSGSDANNNGRIDFGEFKTFARYAKVQKFARKPPPKRRMSMKKVVPSEKQSERAKKRSAGVGQSSGYSKEAQALLRRKKEARANEIAEMAARNAATKKAMKKRISAREKEAAEKTRSSMENSKHFKNKKKLDDAHDKDRDATKRSSKEHERSYAKTAANLNNQVQDMKSKHSVDASQMNTDYLKRKAERNTQREEELEAAHASVRVHERETNKKAAELDAQVAAIRARTTVDQSQMNTDYTENKAEFDAKREKDLVAALAAIKAHEHEVAKKAKELDAEVAAVKAKKTVDESQMNTEYEEMKKAHEAQHELDMAKEKRASQAHERAVKTKSAELDGEVAAVKAKHSVDASQMNTDYLERKAELDVQREQELIEAQERLHEHERETNKKAAELDARVAAIRAKQTVDPDQMNTEHAEKKAELDAQREQELVDALAAIKVHEHEVAKKAKQLDAEVAAVKAKKTIDESKMNTEYAEIKKNLDAEHEADMAQHQRASKVHEREVNARAAELNAAVNDAKAK
jgi:hypothetical protein